MDVIIKTVLVGGFAISPIEERRHFTTGPIKSTFARDIIHPNPKGPIGAAVAQGDARSHISRAHRGRERVATGEQPNHAAAAPAAGALFHRKPAL